MKRGFVYIISNESFPGFYKIGITQNIKNRLRTYQTSDPKRRYKIEFYIEHSDCLGAEKRIREAMHYFAFSRKNEWYEIPLHMAISRLEEDVEYYSSNNLK